MKRISTSVLMLLVSLVSIGWAQQIASQKKTQQVGAQPLNTQSILYDNFNQTWLDPAKWQPMRTSCGGALECVREIQNGKLRLAVRNFGRTDSDYGVQWSESEVYFLNPTAITEITADVTVRSFSGIGCATNDSDMTHTQVMIGGNFFNPGTGDPNDDVAAWLLNWVDISDPKTVSVGGGWWGSTQSNETGIATYPIGTPLTATIRWDKANHQFIFKVKAKGQVGPGSKVVMPYGVSDTLPPAYPMKNLNAEAHTLNCTSGQTTGQVEATYDNVRINP